MFFRVEKSADAHICASGVNFMLKFITRPSLDVHSAGGNRIQGQSPWHVAFVTIPIFAYEMRLSKPQGIICRATRNGSTHLLSK